MLPVTAHITIRAEAQVQPGPPPQPVALVGAPVVEFFGIPLEGAQDVVFALDCSGSMDDPAQGVVATIRPTAPAPPPGPPPIAPPPAMAPPPSPAPRKIDVAKSELIEALEKLPAGTRMNVVFFNSGVAGYAASIVPIDDTTRGGLIAFVRSTEPTGLTALAPALRTAFTMNAHRIVLLSDGLGNVGGGADSVLRDAREAIRGGIRIDTIGLGVDQDPALLGTLARESGGIYQAL